MIGSTSTAQAPRQTVVSGGWIVAGLLVLGSLGIAAGAVAGNGNVAATVAPVVLAVVLGAMWFAPIRVPLLAVIFLSLALDTMTEGPWRSPLAPIGTLLAVNLNESIPVHALAVPGVVLVLAYLLVIHLHRRIRGVQIDSGGRLMSVGVSVQSFGVSFAAVLAMCAFGYKNGGDLQMAKIQVQTFVLVLLVAYLSALSLRGVRDYRRLGALIIAAACIKAVYAVWVVYKVPPPFEVSGGRLAVATTHGDSMLFACATVMLIVSFAERPVRRNALFCMTLLPVLVAGMRANNRRMVWVEVAAGLLAYAIISRRSNLKRLAARAILAAVPVLVVYVAAGWNSQSGLFAPVHVFRSVGDGQVDPSTLYRDLENYNLLATVRFNPVTGTGFGHPFAEPVKLPDISFFKEYRYMPHNSLLGVWAFCGPFGFTGLFAAFVVSVFLAARSYQYARVPQERVAAFMAIAAVVIFLVHCWGDIGFSERRSIYLVGPALAIAGQLALSTGAWRALVTRRHS